MKDFLKSVLEALVVINVIAWSIPILEEIKIDRMVRVDGIVIKSRAIDDSLLTSQGTVINIDQASVKVKYEVNRQVYENEIETGWLDGGQKTGNELKSFYYEGRTISVWINPEKPNEARLDRENTYFVVPELFLFVLLIVSAFYFFVPKKISSQSSPRRMG